MSSSLAIVGMACRYPDARSPGELWENVLAGRRAFRRLPPERLLLEDYLSANPHAPDSIYSTEAALIEDYEFDRIRFRVAGDTFRSADLAHWLALDVATQAFIDAGFADGEGLPRETTGVFLGNTLTGEFSRANTLRLRWPYVKRIVGASLADEGWSPERHRDFLKKLESAYKEPFPPINEESLAGSLSNTIAGRICNHFDLQGGGYTVDGACASSLLAVANACSALIAGDLDVALAGGVDLSLDPFELVGFAKTGALASDVMRVYDARSNGFWPGEGCGFVMLMREDDAVAHRLRVYAKIRGWGISSDGKGGITRPEAEGQLVALRRAYRRAGFGVETVAYFEGHGTGTSVGDAVELQALSSARREAAVGHATPAAIGSVKANIGHTKAAAGVAGLIKATLALSAGILPPTTGCDEPRAELQDETPALRILRKGEPWPADQQLRAGVSSMGFGGINAHLVLEAEEQRAHQTVNVKDLALLSSSQDAELFLFSARNTDELQRQLDHLLTFSAKLSLAELSDLAARLESSLSNYSLRAAVVAASPATLTDSLEKLKAIIESEAGVWIDPQSTVFFSARTLEPRLGFLFPGQGSPSHSDGGALRRRFDFVEDLYERSQPERAHDDTVTLVAQPAIVTASMAALRVLELLNVKAQVAVGHSLGELTALHWAGALDEASLLRLARARGQAMMEINAHDGAMASINAGRLEVEELLDGAKVVIACLNSPFQTVLSGKAEALEAVIARARSKDIHAVKLPVKHAFHSPLVAAVAPILSAYLLSEDLKPLQRTVVSTVTGDFLAPDANLSALLCEQITSPVRFMEAASRTDAEGVDLWLEVGPGHVLRGLMGEMIRTPVVSLDAGGPSLEGLLCAVAAAFVLGQPIRHQALFAGRFTRPFNLNWSRKFFINPCELAPAPQTLSPQGAEIEREKAERKVEIQAPGNVPDPSALELILRMVAERVELPLLTIKPDSRLLSDLHLNSITVSQLVAEAARRLGLPRPTSPIDFADATVAEIAQALEEHSDPGHRAPSSETDSLPPGIDSWIRPFTVELVESPLPQRQTTTGGGGWQVLAPAGHLLAGSLRRGFKACGTGSGVVVCLPPEPDQEVVSLLLAGAKAVLEKEGAAKFVLVQQGGSAAAFARTLHLEAPHVTTCVVNAPQSHRRSAEWVIAEALAAEGYVEAHYNSEGQRHEPVMRSLSMMNEDGGLPLSASDVLVVTGGGKGITAECALSLARETGARLALIGLAQPEADTILASNIERMRAAGLSFRYISVDITDAEAVRAAIRRIERELGLVTGILHGAAKNEPQLISNLDEEAFQRTLAVKVQGARNLLAAIHPEQLRLFITFGSIIARTGLPGEADYGLANEWLTRLTEKWQAAHPDCRCLAVEWSIWSGVGMGARLGRVDVSMRQGIVPIPPDEGVSILRRLLSQPLPVAQVVVMGRFRQMPTYKIEQPELPLLRFLEQPRVYYPNVELVVDIDLSTGTDPYLNDHQVQGERLLPGVMGLEAMAQVATALAGSTKLPIFQEVKFNRPLVVPEIGSLKIRIAALARDGGSIEVVLLSEETAFQVDHFRATCRFDHASLGDIEQFGSRFENGNMGSPVSINPERDLYGNILFHRGRFRRLSNYRLLKAKECLAEIASDGTTAWFSQYLPGKLVLGDPGARDAAIHAVQACVPHALLLPIEVDRVLLNPARDGVPLFAHARERAHHGNTFTYDLQVMEADGSVRERWEGLRLRAVGSVTHQGPWAVSLLSPYLERRVEELIPGSLVTVALEGDAEAERRVHSDRVMQLALGENLAVLRRPDGKPEINGKRAICAAHTGNLTLALAGPGPLGCDIEQVVERSASAWRDLLGEHRAALAEIIAHNAGEDYSTSATRVWCASECLKKAGAGFNAPLLFTASEAEGWVLLSSGRLKLATCVAQVRDHEGNVVIAVSVRATGGTDEY